MNKDPVRHLADGGTLIVPHRLIGARLEYTYARHKRANGARAFPTPDVLTVDSWLRRLWQERAEQLTTRLISRAQSHCLWEQIVIARGNPGGLLGTHQAARWAAEAWRDLQHFHIDPAAVVGPADTRTFLSWAREYQATLLKNSWVDSDQALVELGRQPMTVASGTRAILWMAGISPSPAQTRMPAALAEAGWPIRIAGPTAAAATATRASLADESAELEAALAWARDRREQGVGGTALVIPDLATRRAEVRALLGHRPNGTLGTDFMFADGEAAADLPALGAAITALSLAAGSSDFGTVSRFLRSPFIAACIADRPAAARLEVRLRRAPAHHWKLFEAMTDRRFQGSLAHSCPALTAALQRAAAVLSDKPGRLAVSQWAEIWQRYLEPLGWPAGLSNDSHGHAIRLWQDLLAELAALSPMLPALDQRAALQQLRQVAGRLRQPTGTVNGAVEILGSIMDLGPEHDAVWIMGMDRDQWPPRPQPNPFLPIGLQREAGMPLADASRARMLAEAAWQNARCSTRTLIASWPATRREEPTQPSWMLTGLPCVSYPMSGPATRQPPPLLSVPDPAPPLPVARIPGGTRGLAMQSSCPLRAFLEMRLGARELEAPSRGIAPWRRGLLAHRALELLYGGVAGSQDLQDLAGFPERIEAAVRRATAEQLGEVRGLQRRIVELERVRLAARIQALLELERRRPRFAIEGLELRRPLTLDGLTVEARLDRLDRDEHGRLLVIDYKTGTARVSDWLTPRPIDVQVPLYVLAVGDSVGAALIVDLKSEPPRYRGLWTDPVELPARNALAAHSLADLIAHWRVEMTQLAVEMAAGDARMLPDRAAAAQGAFAPATRIFERLSE